MRIFGKRSTTKITEKSLAALEAVTEELAVMKGAQTGGTSSMHALGYAQSQRDAAIRLAKLIEEKMTDG